MNPSRVDRIEAQVRPRGTCCRVDWAQGAPAPCPWDGELSPVPEICEACKRASEKYHFQVSWTGRRSGD